MTTPLGNFKKCAAPAVQGEKGNTMKTEKFKVTPLERAWILYDVGNSAFVLMIATLVPIFFNALAEAGGVSKVDYLAYWGYASSIVTVVTAILGPILGTLADTKGFKKPIFMLCLFVGVIGCCAMGLAGTWLAFLIIFIIAKIIPVEKSGEYFGLFDICGKGASFLGTMIVSVGSQLTGSANVGIGMLAVLFAVGFVLFRVSCRTENAKQV